MQRQFTNPVLDQLLQPLQRGYCCCYTNSHRSVIARLCRKINAVSDCVRLAGIRKGWAITNRGRYCRADFWWRLFPLQSHRYSCTNVSTRSEVELTPTTQLTEDKTHLIAARG